MVLTNVAVRFVLPSDAADAVTTTYSPLAELALSLRVLAFPHKHPLRHAWLRRARRLEPELRARIRSFRFAFRCGMPDALFPSTGGPAEPFADEFERLRSLDPATMASQLEGMVRMDGRLRRRNGWALAGAELAEAAVASFGADGHDQAATIRLLVADPERAVEQLLALIHDYWQASFQDDWRSIEPVLARADDALGPQLEDDFFGTVAEVQHQLRVDPRARSIAFDFGPDRALAAARDHKLVIGQSTFMWPNVMVKFDPPGATGFIVPAPIARRAADACPVDLDLIKVSKALGDPTRLRALKLLAREARTTQDLAPLLGITESGLSKHLRILAEAGIVRTRREGYYVIYSVVPQRIAALSGELLDFLRCEPAGFASGESVAASANE